MSVLVLAFAGEQACDDGGDETGCHGSGEGEAVGWWRLET